MSSNGNVIPILREFVNRNSKIVDLQFDPNIPPKLLFNPLSKSHKHRKKAAHYFLLVNSIDESRVIGRTENSRCLMVELHKKFEDKLFEISEAKTFSVEVANSRRYGEHGPLKEQISQILSSVNVFVEEFAQSDLIEYSQHFDQPKDMVEEIGRHVVRMGGLVQAKAWVYMRWMVRPKPDLRIFSHFTPKELFMPLSKDVRRVAVCLKLVDQEPAKDLGAWEEVEKVTQFCKKLFPNDPVKCDYSFFLIGRWLDGKTLTMRNLVRTLKIFDIFYDRTRCSILLRKEKRRFSAECPMLPGCITEADTETEALLRMENAISAYRDSIGRYTLEVE